MTFFDRAEPMPAWPWSPPRNKIAVPVPWRLVLLRTGDTAVAVTNISATPEGVLLSLVAFVRPVDGDAEGPFSNGFPAGLRFGIRLPDGSQVDKDGELARDVHRLPPPPGYHLSSLGGQAGDTVSQQDLWLWPLLGSGSLAFACAWPSRDASETVVEIDTSPLLEAAARSGELWPLLSHADTAPPPA